LGLVRARSGSARAAPRLITDGAICHAPQPELHQRLHLAALEAHEADQHLVAVPIIDGGRAAFPWRTWLFRLGFLLRLRFHHRSNLVEHPVLPPLELLTAHARSPI